MEQYINVLSKSIPGWNVDNAGEDAKHNKDNDSPEEVVSNRSNSDVNLFLLNQLSSGTQRKLEDPSPTETQTTSGGLKLLEQGNVTFILDDFLALLSC
ncbi:hypothetical protein AXF42_Ash006416 [Apostasia shenzhenica]|uniref:Uncharacterized protein n=1 Tax=Apostasia shenzhenica TaxID=1088818 RepID=A0A2I0AZ08_9ASPA|nr:hypothetical protein AXF42_Ash006416 [Apostasia shenzhenica]